MTEQRPLKMALALKPGVDAADIEAQAVAWARRLGAKIDVLAVGESSQGAQWIETRHAGLPEDVRGGREVLAGRPIEALCAASEGYDLLTIGTHHHRDVPRLFLGSVAELLVRRARCPVLVLSRGVSPVAADGPLGVRAPIDASTPNGVAIDWVVQHLPAATPVVVYSLPWVSLFGPPPTSGHDTYDSAVETLEDALKGLGHGKLPHLVVVRPEMNVGDAIAHEAEEAEIALVAITTHGRRGLSRAVLGSVAERVVRASHVAVLVVR